MAKIAIQILFVASILVASLAVAWQSDDTQWQRAPGEWSEDDQLLSAYHWRLQHAVDQEGQRIDALFVNLDRPLQLSFNEGWFNVRHSCNEISGTYKIVDGQFVVGLGTKTLMGCEDSKISKLDGEIGERLNTKPRIQLRRGANPRLRLLTDTGDTLDFNGRPTGETRYGSKGEFIHLEVDAQKRPCSHPLFSDDQCLLVREHFYEDSPLKSRTNGEWELLYQDIEGYVHRPGHGVVLSVKRFKIRNAPPNAPSSVLMLSVLD